jgi:ABC-type phosphate transport system auxiliary subunit
VSALETETTQLKEKLIIAAHEVATSATQGVPADNNKMAKSFQVLQEKVHALQAELSDKYVLLSMNHSCNVTAHAFRMCGSDFYSFEKHVLGVRLFGAMSLLGCFLDSLVHSFIEID